MGFQPEVGRALSSERVREAARAGAETILSPCAGCVSSLEGVAGTEGLTTEDVVAPLARALGIEHENRLAAILAGESADEVLERAAGGLWEETHGRDQMERFVTTILARRAQN